jgi:hypothetical protein
MKQKYRVVEVIDNRPPKHRNQTFENGGARQARGAVNENCVVATYHRQVADATSEGRRHAHGLCKHSAGFIHEVSQLHIRKR